MVFPNASACNREFALREFGDRAITQDENAGTLRRIAMSASADATAPQAQTAREQSIDTLTVICIAIVAYLLAAFVHEGVGHGITAAVLGARDLRVSSAALHLDSKSISPVASRLIAIAGPAVGLLIGLLLALCHAHTRSRNANFRFCLWLTAYVCLFANSGYLMALSLFHFGDIHGFVGGLDYEFALRLGLTALGVVLSFVTLYFAARTLDEFLGRIQRRGRAAKLLLISYFAGSAPLILSTFLGKDGSTLALVSAIPATLGGTVMLLYTILCVGGAKTSTDPIPLTPAKSFAWYGAGVMALLIYGFVLGPGVPR
jgi:hypothetical protein